KVNYIVGFLVFWFSLSLTRLIASVGNGSDLVLNIFLFICIFLSTSPKLESRKKPEFQILVSNAALFLGQIQLALIYFLSGYDKLTSAAWQNGAAMHSITNLTFFQNPFLRLELTQLQCLMLSWLIILFELGFSMLIWFKKFRIPFLTMGVIFHFGIVFFLGLADFGIVMIICYLVYIPWDNWYLGKPVGAVHQDSNLR
ncbi:MAG: HTTM domain-containing protein, partial [Cyclobacteriaceae bacterium]